MSDIDMWHHILLSTSLKVKKGSQGKECWIVCFRGNSSHVWTRVSAAKFPREDDVKARLHSSCCSTAPELLPIEWTWSSNSSLVKIKRSVPILVWSRLRGQHKKFLKEYDVKARLHSSCCSTAPLAPTHRIEIQCHF